MFFASGFFWAKAGTLRAIRAMAVETPARRNMASSSKGSVGRHVGDLARGTGQLENMHAVVGAIDDVDEAAIVDLDIVGLDRDLAALLAALELDAALVGIAV